MRTDTFIRRNGFCLKMAACLAVSLLAGIGCRSQEIALRQAARRESVRHMFANFRTQEENRAASIEKVFSEWQRLQDERNIAFKNPPNFAELLTMGIAAPVKK